MPGGDILSESRYADSIFCGILASDIRDVAGPAPGYMSSCFPLQEV